LRDRFLVFRRRIEDAGDIVDPSPIWLKSLSHYRNRKNTDSSN